MHSCLDVSIVLPLVVLVATEHCSLNFIVAKQLFGASFYRRNNPAWRHKEQLLQFDREFASRTIVLDYMANYESDQVAAWLTPEQQEEAAQKEQERQDQLHKRKNMELNIAM